MRSDFVAKFMQVTSCEEVSALALGKKDVNPAARNNAAIRATSLDIEFLGMVSAFNARCELVGEEIS